MQQLPADSVGLLQGSIDCFVSVFRVAQQRMPCPCKMCADLVRLAGKQLCLCISDRPDAGKLQAGEGFDPCFDFVRALHRLCQNFNLIFFRILQKITGQNLFFLYFPEQKEPIILMNLPVSDQSCEFLRSQKAFAA